MDARLLFPKEFLCSADLHGKDVILTISRLAQEDLRTDKGDEAKWIVYFVEMEERHKKDKKKLNKKLVLNKTNAKAITKALGNETNDWLGKKIALYPTTCQAFGSTVDCIRVRDRAPKESKKGVEPPPENMEGDEPPMGELESDRGGNDYAGDSAP